MSHQETDRAYIGQQAAARQGGLSDRMVGVPKQPTEISGLIERIAATVRGISEARSELRAKLDCVIVERPEPTGIAKDQIRAAVGSSLGHQLEDILGQLESERRLLNSTVESLVL